LWAACSWRPHLFPSESAANQPIMQDVLCSGKTKYTWIANAETL
jgi:hypothetical protein